jgi:CDP-diacylglycerol--serine O-phosphatidyltransferase
MSDLMLSGWLIFIAMIFDALDGHVARLSHTSSDFGAELDSLCDVISFGVAPAFLLVKMCPRFAFLHREAVWIIAATFAACAALRLARFNVETSDEDDHLHFSGLPSPAAAGAIAGFPIVFSTLIDPEVGVPERAAAIFSVLQTVLQTVLPFFAILLALLMVSRIPYPHVVNQIFRGQRSFSHVVKLVFAIVAVMVIKGYAVPIVFCAFALSGPARLIWEKVVNRREQEEPIF